MGGVIGSQGCGDVWAHVWVCGPIVVMSMAPDTTKSREDRIVQSWPHPSLAAILGRTDPAPLQDLGEQVLHLAWVAP